MASAYGNQVQRWRSKVVADITSQTDTQTTVRVRCYWCSVSYGYRVFANGTAYNGSQTSYAEFSARSGTGETVETLVTEKTVTYTRTNSNQNIACKAVVNVTGGFHNGTSTATVTVTIPARTRTPHGNPTLNLSKTSVNYGDSVTATWAKSATQGNANFDHFELYIGSTKTYTGTGTSSSFKPSDYTGPSGGDLTVKIREVHEWYGSYPYTEASKTINVKSGVVTVYDSSGNKRTGLVTVYDDSGNAHNVLITAYDSEGKAHSVQ